MNGIVALGDQPRNIHNVYIVYSMDYVDGIPVPDNVEVDGAGFFSLEEMESMNVAELTRRLADIAFEKPSHGLVSDPNLVQSLPGYKLYRSQNL